jgi:RNA polymerase sigma factor (sigma-70 family)
VKLAFAATHNWPDAEDIAQGVFLVAHRRLSEFDGQAPWPWLAEITRLTIKGLFRDLARKPMGKFGLNPVNITRTDRPGHVLRPHEVWRSLADLEPEDTAVAMDTVRRCLKYLGPDQATAITMVDVEGRDPSIVAKELNITKPALWARLSRGRRALRKCLEGGD